MAVFTSVALGGAGLFNLGAGLAAAVSAVALNAAVGIGLSLAVTALATGESSTSASESGVNGTLQAGGDIARSIILGRRATAGSLAYANTWGSAGGTPNAYLAQVISLADLPVKGLLRLYVNGEICTVDWDSSHADGVGHPVTEYRVDGTDYLWVKFYDGSQTAADPYLVSKFQPPNSRPYLNTRVGRGVAYAIVTSRVNSSLFSGFPTFRFELSGSRLYDISKDSTAGGDGPQRLSDPSTWGGDGDDLPVVQTYNVMRGIRWEGEWLYGLQSVAGAQLPAAHWISQIEKCRTLVAGIDGDEMQYLTSAEISVSTEIGKSIELFLTGCQGRMSETGGIYKMRVGEPEAPVFDYSDADILSTEDQTYVPFFGLSETVNGISAIYPEPEEGWNNKTAPPLYNAGHEAQDGGRRLLTEISFDAVYRSSQVQRLEESALKEARRARRLTHVLPPFAQILEPGDVVRLTSTRNSFEVKQFRVDGVIDKANLDVIVDITEVDPTDYQPSGNYTPPSFSPLGPVRPAAQIMTGWTVVASNIEGKRPAMQVGCAADLDDVARIWVQVRAKSTGVVVFDNDSSVYAPPYAWLLSGAWCLSLATYEVRGKYVPYSNRETEWSSWLEVTMGDYAETDLIVSLGDLNSDVIAQFTDLQSQMNNLRPKIERMAVDLTLMAAASQIARETLVAESGQARVEIVEEKRVRADETSALSQLYTALQSSFASNAASVQTMLSTLATADQALASSISLVEATAAGNTAAITTEATTRATADSALASDITQLYAETDANEAAITAETTARTNADSSLASSISTVATTANNASAAVTAETTARTNADSALATSITGVSTDFNGRFAQGLIQFQAASAPSGVDARFAVLVRGGTSQSFKLSGLYIDLYTVGGVQKSRVAIMTDQFVVTDGSAVNLPLVYEDGILKLANARVAWAQIDDVDIGWADIDNAVINNLVVGTSNLDFSTVTSRASFSKSTTTFTSATASDWTTMASIAMSNPNPNPVICYINGTLTGVSSPDGTLTYEVRVVNSTTGEVVYSYSLVRAMGSGSSSITISASGMTLNDQQGSNTYAIQVRCTGYYQNVYNGSIDMTVKMLWWKR